MSSNAARTTSTMIATSESTIATPVCFALARGALAPSAGGARPAEGQARLTAATRRDGGCPRAEAARRRRARAAAAPPAALAAVKLASPSGLSAARGKDADEEKLTSGPRSARRDSKPSRILPCRPRPVTANRRRRVPAAASESAGQRHTPSAAKRERGRRRRTDPELERAGEPGPEDPSEELCRDDGSEGGRGPVEPRRCRDPGLQRSPHEEQTPRRRSPPPRPGSPRRRRSAAGEDGPPESFVGAGSPAGLERRRPPRVVPGARIPRPRRW